LSAAFVLLDIFVVSI